MTSRWLSRKEAAAHVGLSVRTLEQWAHDGIGPMPSKLPGGTVRYRLSELDAYLESLRLPSKPGGVVGLHARRPTMALNAAGHSIHRDLSARMRGEEGR